MKGSVALRNSARAPIMNDNSGATITTGAYVQLTASLTNPVSGIELQNTSSKVIKIAVGGAGAEVDVAAIAPGINGAILPIEIKKGARISARALTADATTGYLVINFLA